MPNRMRLSVGRGLVAWTLLGLLVAGCGGDATEAKRVAHYKERFSAGDDEALEEVVALGKEGVPLLQELLEDMDPRVATKAAEAARSLGEGAGALMPSLMAALEEHPDYVVLTEVIMAQKDAAVPHLADALASPNRKLRIRAAMLCGQLHEYGELSVPALVETLKDEDPEVRLAAIAALGFMREKGEPALAALRAIAAEQGPQAGFAESSARRIEHSVEIERQRAEQD